MNKRIVLVLILVCVLCSSVFALWTFVPEKQCEKVTTASLLSTLVKEKAKLMSYNFETNEFVGVSDKGYFKTNNKVGCTRNGLPPPPPLSNFESFKTMNCSRCI